MDSWTGEQSVAETHNMAAVITESADDSERNSRISDVDLGPLDNIGSLLALNKMVDP